jgi:hypothetical protein
MEGLAYSPSLAVRVWEKKIAPEESLVGLRV